MVLEVCESATVCEFVASLSHMSSFYGWKQASLIGHSFVHGLMMTTERGLYHAKGHRLSEDHA
jgi:hypothetical protein